MRGVKRRHTEYRYVLWKDKTFVRKHSVEFLESMRIFIAISAAMNFFTIILMVLSAIYTQLKIPMLLIGVCACIAIMIGVTADNRSTERFFQAMYASYAHTDDQWNTKIKRKRAYSISFISLLSLYCAICVGISLYQLIGRKTSDVNSITVLTSGITLQFIYTVVSFYNSLYRPFVFFGRDEGMLFGGALFRYETLSGFTPTGEGNGFVLNYGGKEVARGNMLLYDQNRLQEMLESRDRAE